MGIGNFENRYKMISFWSWNMDMNESEVRSQIRGFAEQGFGGFFVHSRAGLTIEYMKEDWFKACEVAIEEAERLGLNVWIYDEDGWPSGFAGGKVPALGDDYCSKKVIFRTGRPQGKDIGVLAAYRRNGDGYRRVDLDNADDEDLFCCYNINRHYVDLLYHDVTAKFIEFTHEVYYKRFSEYFGTVIKGAFTDEPQIPTEGPSWSVAMPEYWKEKFGEDILDKFWLLCIKGEGYREFRYHFYKMESELLNLNFSAQLDDWCEKHGIVFTGHFANEDGICFQSTASCGVMSNYAHMGIPGIDHLGRRLTSPVLCKQLSSAAHQTGKKYILSESYGCSGWDVSFNDLLGITGWQAVHGVNTICAHLSAFSILGRRKRDYPAFFSYQEPWYNDLHSLISYNETLLGEITESERLTNVAVLSAIGSLYCENAPGSVETENKRASGEFRKLVENLEDIHIDFDLTDETLFEKMTVNEGRIGNRYVTYSMVIVPDMNSVAESTAKKLLEFSASGGKIMFVNGRPSLIEGREDDPLAEELAEIDATEIANNRNIFQKYFKSYPVQDNIRVLDERFCDDASGITMYYGKTEYGYVCYLFNHCLGHTIKAIVKQKGDCTVSVLDPSNGVETELKSSCDGNYTYARVEVPSYGGLLLRIRPDAVRTASVMPETDSVKLFRADTVTLTDENALTLDYCRFRMNDGEYSEKIPVIHISDIIYKKLAELGGKAKVDVEFEFTSEMTETDTLKLIAENVENMKLSLNGTSLKPDGGWWVDKGFLSYDISALVKAGVNKVVQTYSIGGQSGLDDFSQVFESERNRFFYKVEPECVYIKGNFDVKYTGKALDRITHYSLINGDFVLADASPKHPGELTCQDLWFYRGDAELRGTVEYNGGRVYASFDELNGVLASVTVNGKFAGFLLTQGQRVELTELLKTGSNDVVITVKGHNRNLLGPHHHLKGQNYFVGPDTFKGTLGWEDFFSPDLTKGATWTDAYAFVPFGNGKIYVEYCK